MFFIHNDCRENPCRTQGHNMDVTYTRLPLNSYPMLMVFLWPFLDRIHFAFLHVIMWGHIQQTMKCCS